MLWRRRLAYTSGTLVGLLFVCFLVLQTTFVQSKIADYLAKLVSGMMTDGELSIEQFELTGLSQLDFSGVRLRDGENTQHLGVDKLEVLWSPAALLRGRVELRELLVDGCDLDLIVDESGEIGLIKLFESGETSAEASSLEWSVDQLEIASLHLNYRGSVGQQTGVLIHVESGSAWGSGEDWAIERLGVQGTLEGDEGFDWKLGGSVRSVEGILQVEDLMAATPHATLKLAGTVENGEVAKLSGKIEKFDLTQLGLEAGLMSGYFGVDGSLDWAHLTLALSDVIPNRGDISVDAHVALLGDEPLWKVALSLEELHLEPYVPSVEEPLVMDGKVYVHGKGFGWPDDLEAEIYAELDKPLQYGDQQIAAFELQGYLDQGRLQIGSLRSALDNLGKVRGFGDIDLIEGAMLARLDGDIIPVQFGLGGKGSFQATLTGNAYELPVDLDARVNLRGASWGDDLLAGDLTLQLASSLGTEELGFQGDLSGRNIRVFGGLVDRLDIRSLSGSLVDGASVFTWKGELSSLHWGRDIHGHSTQIEGRVELKDDRVFADVYGILGPMNISGFPVSNGAFRLKQRGDDLEAFVDLVDGERTVFSTEALVDLKARRVRLPRFVVAPTARVTWETDPLFGFQWTEAGVADVQVVLHSQQGSLSVHGDLAPGKPLAATVELKSFALDVLAELFPERFSGLFGTLDGQMSVSGSAEDPTVFGDFRGRRLWLPGVSRAVDLEGSWELSGGTLLAKSTASVEETPFVVFGAELPVTLNWDGGELRVEDSMEVDIHMPPLNIEELRPLIPVLAGWPEGRLGGALAMRGSLDKPFFSGNGVAELKLPSQQDTARIEWGLTETDGIFDGNLWGYLGHLEQLNAGITGRSYLRDQLMALIRSEDRPDEWFDGMNLTGQIQDVDVLNLLAFSGSRLPLTGSLQGSFEIAGSPFRPEISTDLTWDDGRVGGELFETARLLITPARGGSEVDLTWRFDDQTWLSVTGDVPVTIDLERPTEEWFSDGMALAIEGPGFPLGVASLIDPGIVDSKGRVKVWGAIGGSLYDPKGRLTLSSTGGGFRYHPLNIRVEGLKLKSELNDRELILDELRAVTLPSRDWLSAVTEEQGSVVQMSGVIGLDGQVAAKLRMREAWLAASHNLRIRLNGGVDVSGKWPALEIVGSPGLDLVTGKIVLDATAFVDQSSLTLDSVIQTHRGIGSTAVAIQSNTESWLDSFIVDLPITLNRNLETEIRMPFVEDMGGLGAVVSSMDLNARLGSVQSGEGQLVFSMNQGDLLLSGDVNVLEGKISVLQTKFNLSEGSLRYLGGPVYEPALDIKGEMGTSYDLSVRVLGTPSIPEVVLSSESYPDTAEQMTILLTGRPPDELSQNEGVHMASSLAELLLNSVFSNLELGSLSLEPGGSVRVGMPLSDVVYAESLLDLQPDLNDNRVTLLLEWTILPRLLMLTTLGEQRSGAEMLWEYRF